MDWAAIRAAIRTAVVSATGLAASRVYWGDTKEEAAMRLSPSIKLKLRSPQDVGWDETRYEFDEEEDKLVPVRCGQRRFVVTISVEAQDQTDGRESVGALSSTLRTRLQRASVRAALRTSGVALSDVLTTQEHDYSAEDRRISVGITDVVFLAAENDVDTSDPGDYIATVEATTAYTGQTPQVLEIGE